MTDAREEKGMKGARRERNDGWDRREKRKG